MPRLKEPFGKEAYARWAPIVLGYASFIGYLTRVSIHLLAEMIWHGLFMLENVKWRSKVEKSLLDRMRSKVPEKYHEIMTPNYPYGCKRRVFDDEWLDTMSSPNFHLTTEHLTRLVPDGVILGPGHAYPENLIEKDSTTLERHVPTDTIILADGFDAVSWMYPLMVYGRGGKSMQDVWKDRGGAQAYMGTSLDGFPNLFKTLGPNSANGHAPLLTTIEYTIDYTLRIADPVLKGQASYAEPKKVAALRWTHDVQRDFKKTAFVGCRSWYPEDSGWNSKYIRMTLHLSTECSSICVNTLSLQSITK
jgi:cation diffusion facilitator CzcD-associated flavoprotein CzcO